MLLKVHNETPTETIKPKLIKIAKLIKFPKL